MGLTDNDKAVLVLTTRLGNPNRPSLPPIMWHRVSTRLRDAGLFPASLFHSLDPIEEPERPRIQELLSDATTVLLDAEQLHDRGIRALPITNDDYPRRLIDRLGDNAPPVLFHVGDQDLGSGGVGVVGSRNVTPEGAEAAQSIAIEAVRIGKRVVSGGARGVDQLAMNAAYGQRRIGRRCTRRRADQTDPLPRRLADARHGHDMSGHPPTPEHRLLARRRHGAQQAHLRPRRCHRSDCLRPRDRWDMGRGHRGPPPPIRSRRRMARGGRRPWQRRHRTPWRPPHHRAGSTPQRPGTTRPRAPDPALTDGVGQGPAKAMRDRRCANRAQAEAQPDGAARQSRVVVGHGARK